MDSSIFLDDPRPLDAIDVDRKGARSTRSGYTYSIPVVRNCSGDARGGEKRLFGIEAEVSQSVIYQT